jgi:branched-chain amino acid transport system substrate-binding protein
VRVVARTDQQAEALFAARRPALPAAWWALVPPDRPGRAVRRDLAKAARSAGTRMDRILEMGTDPASIARQVAAASPGGVLVWLAPSQAGVAAAALRAAGYQGCVAGPCSIDAPEFVAAAGAAADGVLVAEYEGDSGSRARAGRFAERFMGRFGVRPGYSAAAAHDAAQVLIENLRRAGDTPAYRRFPPVLPSPGVTGEIRFDASGNRTGTLRVLACQRGRFVPIIPPTP